MRKVVIWSLTSLLALGLAGCGDDGSSGPTEPIQEIEQGLTGDTYMNAKFGVKVSNLPVEEWTVKALGGEEQGLLEQSSQGFIPMYHLLLMEPVSEDEFITVSTVEGLAPVLNSGIPFVWIGLDYQKGGNYETGDLSENLNRYAGLHSAEIESKQFVSIGNATAIQAVLIRSFGKEALTWFARGEILVRCEYITEESEFDKYYSVYEQVVENVWLIGR